MCKREDFSYGERLKFIFLRVIHSFIVHNNIYFEDAFVEDTHLCAYECFGQ